METDPLRFSYFPSKSGIAPEQSSSPDCAAKALLDATGRFDSLFFGPLKIATQGFSS
jgi:hypothetical protein